LEKETVPPIDYPDELKGVNILIVDDNATSRDIIQEHLKTWQMPAVHASGAREAQEILQQAAVSGPPIAAALIDSDIAGADGFSLAHWIRSENKMDCKVIMMLTFQHLKRRAEFDGRSVQATIVKPLHAPELLDAICVALGLKTAPPKSAPALVPPKPDISDQPLKILVAEDTPFNQTFIMRLLEKYGYHGALVENGQQVLEALSHHPFDLVLMDVQMPEMDGLEATQRVRELEKQSGDHIPIIAMTAYAVKGDRERCLEAGMDEYVTKPVSAEKLFEAIHALLPGGSGKKKQPHRTEKSFDRQSLLNAFDHDWNLFSELVDIFSKDYPQMLVTLREALSAGDAQTLSRTAHSLKGMLRNFQAEPAADTAFELEQKAKENQLQNLDQLIDKLDNQVADVDQQLRDMVAQKSG
jgi:CheY-like chemotaxis protein/HPt (histidine-containing phosphotransfer) domain-containing protein